MSLKYKLIYSNSDINRKCIKWNTHTTKMQFKFYQQKYVILFWCFQNYHKYLETLKCQYVNTIYCIYESAMKRCKAELKIPHFLHKIYKSQMVKSVNTCSAYHVLFQLTPVIFITNKDNK